MDNQKHKDALIKAYWGDHYDKFNKSGSIDSNGVIQIVNPKHLNTDIEFVQYKDIPNSWIPKELVGLDTNNGWVRILEDGSNLPEDGNYHFYDEWKGDDSEREDDGEDIYVYTQDRKEQFTKLFSHFRPVRPPFPKPLY